MLPQMITSNNYISISKKKILILAEGFEARALSWINSEYNTLIFNRTFICKYLFHKQTRFNEVYNATKKHSTIKPEILEYDRFNPTVFENKILELINQCNDYEEIFIDISVMSKMLIMIILNSLKYFKGNLIIIYSEPETWGPSENMCIEALEKRKIGSWISLSSVGVGDVVRTPNLSSIIMQNYPTFLITFLSFNEQLFGSLINEISPSKIQLINRSCKQQEWREKIMEKIHDDVINEYFGNDIEPIISADVLDYVTVFNKIANIYREQCYDYRIIISPTGGKIHTIAVALLKICCSDIHIEYPTPESYLFTDYSSEKTKAIHQIMFNNFNKFTSDLSIEYGLNG